MMAKGWWSQKYAPEGSAGGGGIKRQLGLSQLDPLTVLVREAAQNSWDARRNEGPVDFTVSLEQLGERAPEWREALLPGPHEGSELGLADALSEDSIVLFVTDRNTVGLGGPTRAGTRPAPGETPNFVQFIRDVGEPRDRVYGGGTYGFGKGIFYKLSRSGAILVDTRTEGPQPQRRLIGAALGESYYVDDQRYTGRHWWGVRHDLIADPLEGNEAATIAGRLGFPEFTDGASGTSIAIIGAKLGQEPDSEGGVLRTIGSAAEFLGSSILWHLWPKFIPDSDNQWMRFRVLVNGQEMHLPSPEELDEFVPFVESLQAVRRGEGSHYLRTVPPKDAGTVAVALTAATVSSSSKLIDAARPFSLPSRHLARMRTVELVVDYLSCPPCLDTRLAYGGVFKASLEADSVFATAEPPTHDAWIVGGLTGAAKGVVQNLSRFLHKAVDEAVNPNRPAPTTETPQGLGRISARLGALIPGLSATGGQPASGSSNNGESDNRGSSQTNGATEATSNTATSPGRPRIIGDPVLEEHDETLRFVARVSVPASRSDQSIRAAIDVVLDGGKAEGQGPEGAAVPTITGWRSIDGTEVIPGSDISLPSGNATEWFVYASHVDNAVVRFRVSRVDGGRHAQ